MNSRSLNPSRIWTISQAKARLSEILRLAETEGPQHIGVRRTFVVVPANVWREKNQPRQSMGRWLVENMPRGIDLDIQTDRKSGRKIPFAVDEIE